jgi:hypothetical protein
MEFDNIETIKRAVEIDAGVALLPQPTVLREVASGSLACVPLATDELVRPLGIIHRRGKELGSTTRRFIELLQSEARMECCGGTSAGSIDGDADAPGRKPAQVVGENGLGDGHAPANGAMHPQSAAPASRAGDSHGLRRPSAERVRRAVAR